MAVSRDINKVKATIVMLEMDIAELLVRLDKIEPGTSLHANVTNTLEIIYARRRAGYDTLRRFGIEIPE